MAKDMTTILIVGGVGVAAYWYLTNYGPSGASYNAAGAKIAPSYWDSWFGTTTAAAAPVTATTQTPAALVNTGTTPSAPQPGVVTQAPAVATAPAFTVTGVTPDINNSLKGQVSINGSPAITLNVIPSAGTVWDTNGNDVTATLTPAQVTQLIAAFQAAAPPSAGMAGLGAQIRTPTRPAIPSMSFGGALAAHRRGGFIN